jgi:DNA-binding NtrC family response regulator
METISPNIYLVEDDPFYNNIVASSLEQTNINYKVKTFTNGKDYLQEIKRNPPDLAIIDYKLGDTDGLELLNQTKSMNPAISVVILSAHKKMEMINAALDRGASYIHKDKSAFNKLKLMAKKTEIDLEEKRDDKVAVWIRVILFTAFALLALIVIIMKYKNPGMFANRG